MDIDDFLHSEEVQEFASEEKKHNYFFDFLNDIYYDKQYIFDDETQIDYKPWNINKFISGNMDTVLYAQEINERYHLDNDMQFDYYFNSIRKRKRYSKWIKSKKDETINLLMEYYNYNRKKSQQIINLHDKDDLEIIKQRLFRGGKTSKRRI